jgi:hypothetical protein
MAAKRHKRHKTRGFRQVDHDGLLHLSSEQQFLIKTVIRIRIYALFVHFCGKSVLLFRLKRRSVSRQCVAAEAGNVRCFPLNSKNLQSSTCNALTL